MKVTTLNIDDIIRENKRNGIRDIYWESYAFEILRKFKPDLKDGDKYLGARHYEKK